MAATQTNYGLYSTIIGTLSEIAEELNAQRVGTEKIINIFHNGTTYVAIYHI